MPADNIFLLVIILICSLAGLMKGADVLIEGSSKLAKKMGVSNLVIGLTVVALGTSLPEFVVSVGAALNQKGELALANVIGSNITNILLVLGATAIITPVPAPSQLIRKDLPLKLLLVMVFTLMACFPREGFAEFTGLVPRTGGVILLLFFMAFILRLILDKGSIEEDQDEEGQAISLAKPTIQIVIGSIGLILGGKFTVDSAVGIAKFAGVSDTTIGLTIVALGTSLPELVASYAAARKGFTGMVVGNVVGSNLMNLALVLGTAATIAPINVDSKTYTDIITMTAITAGMCAILKWRAKPQIDRPMGILFLLGYFSYMTFVAFRAQA